MQHLKSLLYAVLLSGLIISRIKEVIKYYSFMVEELVAKKEGYDNFWVFMEKGLPKFHKEDIANLGL